MKVGEFMSTAKAFSVRGMVFTALFAAVLCAVAPFSIDVGPVPLTFATLVMYVAAGALGWRHGALSVLLYILLGGVGLPVFSRFQGGFQVLAGMTGGYVVGYLPLAIATGVAADLSKKALVRVLGMAIGTVLLYTVGTAWFMLHTGSTLGASLLICVLPFLPGDAAKIAAACAVSPKLRAALGKIDRG